MKSRRSTKIPEWRSHLRMQLFALSAVLLTEAVAALVPSASAADTRLLNRRRTQFPFPQPIVFPLPELEPQRFPTPPSAPPSPPTRPPAHPSPPLPPAPPMFSYADSTAILRAVLKDNTDVSPATQVLLLEQRYFLGGTALNVSNSNITIVGQGLGTIIDAEFLSRHFLVDQGAVLVLRNIKLVSGKDKEGGALAAWRGSAISLEHVTIINCSADAKGGALHINDGSSLDAISSKISACSSGEDGGGICASGSCNVHFSYVNISSCESEKSGGGLRAEDMCIVNLVNCVVERCSSQIFGGGLSLLNTDVQLDRSIFQSCSCIALGGGVSAVITVPAAFRVEISSSTFTDCYSETAGGGVGVYDVYSEAFGLVSDQQSVLVTGTTIKNCLAYELGGGLWLFATDVHVNESKIENCIAHRAGGGVSLRSNSSLVNAAITKSVITNCQSNGFGGGLNIINANTVVRHTSIESCTTRLDGGGIALTGATEFLQSVVIATSTITSCESGDGYGGGLFFEAVNVHTEQTIVNFCSSQWGGGGIAVLGATEFFHSVVIVTSAITDCKSGIERFNPLQNGGGVLIRGINGTPVAVEFVSSAVRRCYSKDSGGGLAFELVHANIEHSTIERCSSYGFGGGMVLDGSDTQSQRWLNFTILNSTISGCRSETKAGGGISLYHANLNMRNSQIEYCRSETEGGGLHATVSSRPNVTPVFLAVEGSVVRGCSSGDVEFGGGGGVSVFYTNAHIHKSIIENCTSNADAGGMISARPADSNVSSYDYVDLNITDSAIRGCRSLGQNSRRFGAGGLSLIDVNMYMKDSSIENCSSVRGSGGMYLLHALAKSPFIHATIVDSEIRGCTSEDGNGGGLSIIGDVQAAMDNVSTVDCHARTGGGLYVDGADVLLRSRSFVRDCTAESGSALELRAGSTYYVFPTPRGYWLPPLQCKVYRQACPTISSLSSEVTEEASYQCHSDFEACSWRTDNLTVTTLLTHCNQSEDASLCCTPEAATQPCPWRQDNSLIHKNVYLFPAEPLNVDLPFACLPGYLGSSDLEDSQGTPLCSGLCPAGKLCLNQPTLEPVPCPLGEFCEEGTLASVPCPPGTYATAINLTSADDCEKCPPGHECDVRTGNTEARACAPGFYAPNSSSARCSRCPAGSLCPANKTVVPEPCPAGKACAEGSARAVSCNPGSYAPANSSECSLCRAGSFQNSSGAGECVPCSAGWWAPEGSLVQLRSACEPGHFAEVTNPSVEPRCEPCPAGSSCAGGSASPIGCGRGLFANGSGFATCIECPPGSFASNVSSPSCTRCIEGTYQGNAGRAECLPCDQGKSSFASATECSICDAGYYKNDSSPSAGCGLCEGRSAFACPSVGTIIANISVNASNWRHSSRTLSLHRCFAYGNWSPCAGGKYAGEDGDGYCKTDYGGPRCEVCLLSNHYFSRFDAKCHDCGIVVVRVTVISCGVLFVLLVAAAVNVAFKRRLDLENPCANRLLRVFRRVWLSWQQLGGQSKLKLLFGFAQVVASVPSVYSVSLPEAKFTKWVQALEWPRLVDAELFIPAECYSQGYLSRLLLVAFLPWAIVLLIYCVNLLRQASCRRRTVVQTQPAPTNTTTSVPRKSFCKAITATAVKALELAARQTMPLALVISFIFVPGVSARILKSFLCDEFEYDDFVHHDKPLEDGGSERKASYHYLHDDYSLDCDSGRYQTVYTWACALIVLWPAGVPLVYTLLLALSKKAVCTHQPSVLSRATRFLWTDYETAVYWWEPVELLRKLTLTGFVLLISNSYELARVLLALLLCTSFLLLQVAVSPFRRAEDNWLSMVLHFALSLVFLAVLLLKVCEGDSEVCKELGFGDEGDGVLLFFLVFSTVVIGVLLLLGAYQLSRIAIGSARTLRLVSTRQPPVLPALTAELRYHLFLSHVWSTGQDQVAVIKRQLQLCVPGVRIFLDVDDLEDISLLEEYVQASAVVLIFLSRSYFASKNCRREVRATAVHKKPIVVVHENDPRKGGAMLADLEAEGKAVADEFPELTILDDIFDRSRCRPHAAIMWHRVGEFQHFALKMIASQMLPTFARTGLERGLYFRGEPSWDAVQFRSTVTVWVGDYKQGASHQNGMQVHGARQVMEELARKLRRQEDVRIVDAADAKLTDAGVFLLYLNADTALQLSKSSNSAGSLAADIERAMRCPQHHILMLHEKDNEHPQRKGCEFERLIEATPAELRQRHLYDDLAIPLYAEPFRDLSMLLAAKALCKLSSAKSEMRQGAETASSAA